MAHGIGARYDNNRNGAGEGEHRPRIDRAHRNDDVGMPGDQLGCGAGDLLPGAAAKTAFDNKVLPLDPPSRARASSKKWRGIVSPWASQPTRA